MTGMCLPRWAGKTLGKIHISRWIVLGISGFVIGIWLFATPDGLLGKADAIGYAVCHRIDARSFHLGIRTLPMCSRCSGTFMGVLIALSYFITVKKKAAIFPSKPILLGLGFFAFTYAVDGINSYLALIPHAPYLYEPHNYLRLSTGMFFGISLMSIVYPALNQSLWLRSQSVPVLSSYRELAILSLLAALFILGVISENPLILYPIAILSTLGVLILLTMVYTMVILMITKNEGVAETWRELIFPCIGGLTLAVIQIGLINLVRYLFMGSWEGFNFL
jgi:uncharacterized membrane protein